MMAFFKSSLLSVFVLISAMNEALAQDTISIKTLTPVTVTAATVRVPHQVWKSFADYFTGAYNSRFFRVNRDYLAKFILDNQDNRALFTKHGSLIYHISYGYEKNLPEEIRSQVKSSYYDYNITRAIQITERDRIIWVINLETPQELIIVRIEEGAMEEVKQFNKS